MRSEHYALAAMEAGLPRSKVTPLLVRVCAASSRVGAAIRYAREALAESPRDWRLKTALGALLLSIGAREQAQQALEDACGRTEASTLPHYLLAVSLYETGNQETGNQESVLDIERAATRKDRVAFHLKTYLERSPHGPHAAEARHILFQLQPSPISKDTGVER